ncbi:MAG: amino acid ABC transporter ATP-binding protein [Erysipelotrichia bacterium]|nr:amino acid ABC transporter ATP-binding protein [Erysipelotrichia bacterium]
MLKVNNLQKSFGELQVLKGIDLTVEKGDVIAIIGPSGSGKTTFLRCLNFLEKADKGTMEFDGQIYDLEKIKHKEIAQIRRKTGFVFQNYNLFANKTVLENVTLALTVVRKTEKKKAEEIGRYFLDKVGLSDKLNNYPAQLSGGQQQRVAIARALATEPEIIYFDEPTSALDPELIDEVLNVIKNLAQESMTMIIVTHEMNFAKNVSNKTIFMDKGTIIEQGNSTDLFNHPQQERTKQFIRMLDRKEDINEKN